METRYMFKQTRSQLSIQVKQLLIGE